MQEVKARCAGGIVLGDGGTIALVRNRKETLWFFPKGHVDLGESDEEAARREIAEETGLTDLEYIDDLGSYERPRIQKDGSDHHEIKSIHMYLFAAPPHSEVRGGMEIAEAQFVSFKHVLESLEHAKDRAWFITVFERVRQAIQRD
ncbi:NUDIX domain-containing protein [Patescibacteria group bacterium]|nr:NUDIX domain-containing protein [Patescibacteria group bacterium]MBU1500522.1 NUDIX domain-containing protein [Patescibacteria group bacterium]MBU2080679.1 NUDIX domain-containing protein [Patescibacteria group bacterium]MBU2123784.1 NUDIX domain-containing protein [Patescibacteria group bacterium]MBU2194925.1 NUDIX domain-containing protein [Patescibacteria group bacterium]